MTKSTATNERAIPRASETIPLSKDQVSASHVRLISSRTAVGLLKFLVRRPGLIPYAIRRAARGSIDTLRDDPGLLYAMELKAVKDVSEKGLLGTQWGSLSTFVAAFSEIARPNDRCLEIGAGGGRLTAQIAPLVGRLTASDISSSLFDEVQRVVGGSVALDFLVLEGLGRNLPLTAYDTVVAADVLTLIPFQDLFQYCESIHSTLRPGGYFVASVKTIDDQAEIDAYMGIVVGNPYQRIHRMPSAAYLSLFTNAGFDVVKTVRNEPAEEFEPGPLHLNVVLRRPVESSASS